MTLAGAFPASGAHAEPLIDAMRACGFVAGEKGTVSSVLDGDTVVLKSGRQVRLVGIQAPKLPLGRRDFEPWPLGDEAREALEALALGRNVQLFYSKSREDRHGRILAHMVVQRPDGAVEEDSEEEGTEVWAERYMLENGLARVYSFADNRICVEEMLGYERQARSRRLGIWADAFYDIRQQWQAGSYLGSFQLIEGRVFDVAEVRTGVYLNFEENWREDFTIFIAKRDLRRFGGKAHELTTFKGQEIRVRGWLKLRNGPMVEVTHPEQIEVPDG
jgi:endonuclease YncB( thermonuclease family)